jgi:threonine dehydrogenase-like Zn-dependent dehydrogenase
LNDDGKATQFYPLILGHEYAGVVDKIGPEAERVYGVKQGDRVTVEPYIGCGHCEYCRQGSYQLCVEGKCYGWSIPATDGKHLNGAYGEYVLVRPNSRVWKLEDNISFKAGALSSVIGNGYHLVMDKAQMKPNESALILGPGALGLCTVVAAKEAGAHPIIAAGIGDADQSRLDLAKELGAYYVIRLDKEDLVERMKEITGGKMADAVFECSGAVPSYKNAFSCVKKTGTIVLLGLNGGKEIPISTDQIVSNELQIKGAIGQPGDVEYAVKTINKGIYPLEKMVTNEFPMSKANEAIEFHIQRKDPSGIRVALLND